MFVCAECGAELTGPVVRVALPVHARSSGGDRWMPPVMEPGTYAVDPEPSGPPWRPWEQVGADEARERGVFAPVGSLSFAAPGDVLLAPGDTRGMRVIPDRCGGYCCGLDGRDGPNLACEHCGTAVATRVDDCYLWQNVRFAAGAIRCCGSGAGAASLEWDSVAASLDAVPPVTPPGYWDARWQAAVGAALAHILAASGGAPVTTPRGVLSETFGRSLARLLPAAGEARTLGVAGPGLPTAGRDIVLVPRHPVTGETWRPRDGTAAVPLEACVWAYLASCRHAIPVPAGRGLPAGVLRDESLPPIPWSPFSPDRHVLLHTLARLPAVREPWLRAIHDRLRGGDGRL